MIPWHITMHAAERYRERLAPGLSVPQAWAWLRDAAPRATALDQRTRAGQELYLVDGVVLVVKQDPRPRQRVVVTVGWWDADDPAVLVVDEPVEHLAAVGAIPGLVSRALPPEPPPPPDPAELQADLEEARRHNAELRAEVAALRSRVAQLTGAKGSAGAIAQQRARTIAAGRLLRLARDMATDAQAMAALPQSIRDRVAYWARQPPDDPSPDDGTVSA